MQGREAVGFPVEGPAIDQNPADGAAMAGQPAGGGRDDDRRAFLDRADEEGQGGIVDCQRDAQFPSGAGCGGDGEALQTGDIEAFGEPQPCARVGRRDKFLDRTGGARLDAETAAWAMAESASSAPA